MPIYQEGQSKANAWFSEEFEFPTEEDSKAVLVVPVKPWIEEAGVLPEENPEQRSESVSDIDELAAESPSEADKNQDSVPQNIPQDSPQTPVPAVHEDTPDALPQNTSTPSVSPDQFQDQTHSIIYDPAPLSPTYADNQASSKPPSLAPLATYNQEVPSKILPQKSSSINTLDELRQKHHQLKVELAMAKLESEIAEMGERLVELRSSKTNRQQTTTWSRDGKLELEFNIKIRH